MELNWDEIEIRFQLLEDSTAVLRVSMPGVRKFGRVVAALLPGPPLAIMTD